MGLLFRSTVRHMKKHWKQAALTFFLAFLIAGMLSALFHFAASFQDVLRRRALEDVGTYHYKFESDIDSLKQVEEKAKNDPWFSVVQLEEWDGGQALFLTVAKPNPFMTQTMYRKLGDLFHGEGKWWRFDFNMNLLASHGDLWKGNGIYTYLCIFFFLVILVSFTAVLTLGAVFRISADEREQDFALLASAGASSRQIGGMILMESIPYIFTAIPLGLLFGMYLMDLGKGRIDDMLKALEDYPPIRLRVSWPILLVIAVVSAAVILICAYSPAKKMARLGAIEVLRQNQKVSVSKWESGKRKVWNDGVLRCVERLFKGEGFLAYKTHARLKKRYNPVLLVLSVNIALCMALSSFSSYAGDMIAISYRGMDYNMSIVLYSDEEESLEATANEIVSLSGDALHFVRQASFEIQSPLPLSKEGEESGLFQGVGRLPDAVLLCVEDEALREICLEAGIGIEELNGNQGIFVNAETTWRQDGAQQSGRIFALEKGDVLTIGSGRPGSVENTERNYEIVAGRLLGSQGEAIDIKIVGKTEKFPQYAFLDEPTSLVVLVSRETFLALESFRPSAKWDDGLHCIRLRGMSGQVGELEARIAAYSKGKTGISIKINNYDEMLRKERASVTGARYLLFGFIAMTLLICLFSNFIVTWTIEHARLKEFAILSSLGMTPREMKKMKRVENLLNGCRVLLTGIGIGLLCSTVLWRMYLTEIYVPWELPWVGVFAAGGMLVLVLAMSEYAMNKVMKEKSIVEIIRMFGNGAQ